MQKLLIDASVLLRLLRKREQLTGIDRVNLAYVLFYQNEAQLVFYRKRRRTFIVASQATSKKICALMTPWNFASYRKIKWLVFLSGLACLLKRPNVSNAFFLKLCGKHKSHYFTALKKLNVHLIAMIHDLIPLEWPAANTAGYAAFIEDLSKHSKGIISVSQTEHDKLISYLRSKDIHNLPTIAAGLASGLENRHEVGSPLVTTPYFVIVGSAAIPRKNHLLLLNVWSKLVDVLGEKTPRLLILGQIKEVKQQEVVLALNEPKLKNLVTLLEVDDHELINYLTYARALLLPSLAEGYGLPLVEALSLGTPVIVNNLPVFHEIAAAVPDYIDASDEDLWLHYIIDYMKKDSLLRQNQLNRLAHFISPSWDKHFEKVNKFLLDVNHADSNANKDLNSLPVSWTGRLFYYFLPVRKKIILENIERVFNGTISKKEKECLTKAFYSHVASIFKELWLLNWRSKGLAQSIEIRGEQHLIDALSNDKGVLLLFGHLGNWELFSPGLASLRLRVGDFYVIRRPLHSKWLQKRLFSHVEYYGHKRIDASGGLMQIKNALKNNGMVMFALDQHTGITKKTGVAAEFFGVKAGTYTSLAYFAGHYKAPVVPLSIYRKPDGRHVIEFHQQLIWKEHEDKHQAIYNNTLYYNQILERLILRHPEQWWWPHRRWKL